MNPPSVNPGTAKTCGVKMCVAARTRVCDEHILLDLTTPAAPDSLPGQFVQILCRNQNNGTETAAGSADGVFLRRPFSIAGQWSADDGVHIEIISRTVGRGTAWLENLSPGDIVDVTGPLGRGFDIPADDVPIVLVGGGVGIPPLLYLARRLQEAGRADVTAILGVTSQGLLPLKLTDTPARDGSASRCAELTGGVDYPTAITTDDGSCGMRGVATDALRVWSKGRPADDLQRGIVYACGPDAMLRAIAAVTCELGLNCQLSIERHMGCGLGTCLSCVVRVADDSRPSGWRWALTCTDGPVFDRDDLRCWD